MTDLSDLGSSAFWRVNPKDSDPQETREWLNAFDAMVQAEGRERATYLLRRLLDHARKRQVQLPPVLNTPYTNTIGLADQPQFPGSLETEQRLSSIVRWNAFHCRDAPGPTHSKCVGLPPPAVHGRWRELAGPR